MKVWIDANSSQAKLARELGCSESHLSDVINGKKEPSLKFAARLSAITGGVVPIEAFLKDRVG